MVKCPEEVAELINANRAYFRAHVSCSSSDVTSEQGRGEAGEEGDFEENLYILDTEPDVVRADKRCPPSTEDEITYMFVSHFLDILLKSWDGKPCLRKKMREPPGTPNPDMFPEDEGLPEEGGIAGSETASLFDASTENLNSIHKTRSQKLSKTDETSPEAILPELCKKPCDSEKVTTSSDTESDAGGEQTISDSELSWKAHVPDEDVHMIFQNGASYNGRVSRRLMDGHGTFYWEDGGSFEGEFIGGAATGFGKLQFPDMSSYEGTVFKGFRHGEGLQHMYDSPMMYSGEWWLGKKSGNGTIFYDDPVRCLNFYVGSWTNGKKSGFGYRQYASGSKYIGFWHKGKRHGSGVMFWCNHDIYRGEWKEGLMDGFGEYTWNGFIRRTLSYPRINTFRGHWEKGKRNGAGLLELKNGAFIETVWVNNEKDGPGVVICPNGSVVISDKLFRHDKPALLNDEEDSLGLLLRNQGYHLQRKGYPKKETPKLPDEAQLISFMSSMEKAKAISIPIHTPVHSLDLSCHVKRFMNQRNELLSKKLGHDSATDIRSKAGLDAMTAENSSYPWDVNLSSEFFSQEEKLLRFSIMINLVKLKEYYEDWSSLPCTEKPSFQCTLLRIFFWEMLAQGDVPRRNFSLIDIDTIIANEDTFMVDFPHGPFEKIHMWKFIHFLITISWYSYGRYVYGDNISPLHPSIEEFLQTVYAENEKAVLAPAFNYFLQKHIFQPNGIIMGKRWIRQKDYVPFEAMYILYKKVGEPHSAKQFLTHIFSEEDMDFPYDKSLYFEKIHVYKKLVSDGLTITRELSYLSSEKPMVYPQTFPPERRSRIREDSELSCFAELGPKRILKCMQRICPNIVEDGLIVDMEYELTFLEFYKVVVTCAEILVKEKALQKMQSQLISNYKRELQEYDKLMKEYDKQKEAAASVSAPPSLTKKGLNVRKSKK